VVAGEGARDLLVNLNIVEDNRPGLWRSHRIRIAATLLSWNRGAAKQAPRNRNVESIVLIMPGLRG
jgi:hypothetical protein